MTIIDIKNVSKKYRLYYEKRSSLKETVLFRGRGKWEDFWVLKDINLQIKKGTTVGLIGQNGSGKSTLLKLLTRIIYPDKGEINITGRVSSLLELGAGFHPDFTGRENIYFNSSIFGLTKKEINKRIDEIVEFSELEEFIDNPVRSYSSGMYMRLAFATAINVNPDILLIDEVLAVGDTGFQKKCLDKINDFKRRGKTIVFVSHDHGVVETLCDVAVLLNKGEPVEVGNTRKVIDTYLTQMAQKNEKRLAEEHILVEKELNEEKSQVESIDIKQEEMATQNDANQQTVENSRWGTREIEITGVKIFDRNNIERYQFNSGESVKVKIFYKVNKKTSKPVFGIGIFHPDGTRCYGTNTFIDKIIIDNLKAIGEVDFCIDELNLVEGTYLLDVAAHAEDGRAYDYHSRRYSLGVSSKIKDVGIAKIKHDWVIC